MPSVGFVVGFDAVKRGAFLALAGTEAIGLPELDDIKAFVTAREDVLVDQFAHFGIGQAKLAILAPTSGCRTLPVRMKYSGCVFPYSLDRHRRRMLMPTARPDAREAAAVIRRVEQLGRIADVMLDEMRAALRTRVPAAHG